MDNWISTLLGGGLIGGIFTAFLSRVSSKEKNSADNNKELWDRTYQLIEYQEKQIEILRAKSEADDEIKRELRETIRNLEQSNRELKRELEQGKRGK